MRRRPSTRLLIALLLSASSTRAVTEPRCYWPDGSLDPSGYVCNLTAVANGGASACCLHNDACYASGSCFQDWSGVAYRQSCTDSSWRDPACPQYCLAQGMQSVAIWMVTCDMGNGKACCQQGGPCCNDTSKWFNWKPGYITAVINGDGTNRLGPYVPANGSSSSSTSSSSSSEATSSTSQAASSQAGTAAGSSSSSSGNSTCPSSSSSSKTGAMAASVALGILFAVSIAALVFLWFRLSAERKRRFETDATLQQAQQQLQQMMGQRMPPYIPAHEMGTDYAAYKKEGAEAELSGTEIGELPAKTGVQHAP